MLGIRFMKASPTTYVLQYKDGKVIREGPGLSFFYFAPTATIVTVPLGSADVPFVFNESTADFQAVTLQGQLSYRIADPKRAASLLDFSLGPARGYASDDPEVLKQRLVHATQILARGITQRMSLGEALIGSEAIVAHILGGLRSVESVSMLGVQVLGLTIVSIQATPEMARALEAGAREALQRKADEAIYARRNAAVEQERTIKQSELQTELAVEEKKREIREMQMAAEIAVEEQRSRLIDHRVANDHKDADSRAYALEATLKPLRDVDWRTLTALFGGKLDPRLMVAQAFRELAENAEKVGQLNISPELLDSLLRETQK